MSMDGKLLARAKARIEERRKAHEREYDDRRREAYAKDPEIGRVDSEIKATVIDAIGAALRAGTDPEEAILELKDRSLTLQENRAMLLVKNGYPADWLTETPICPKCRDTGYNGTELCSCLMDFYRAEQVKELSQLLKLGEESFDAFDINYYPDEYDPRVGASPREMMDGVFESAYEYARKFPSRTRNLFFTGGTGLGKTFLATSIAKVVAEKGYSVAYYTAVDAFEQYRATQFARSPEETERARYEIARLEKADLLIIDDLGTEIPGVVITNALSQLLNARENAKKCTVITSNFSISELGKRYSPQVVSRLAGNFLELKFAGRDIRRLKNGG